MTRDDESPRIIFEFRESEGSPPTLFELVEGREPSMKDLDHSSGIIFAFAAEDVESQMPPPDDPDRFLLDFDNEFEPFKIIPPPPERTLRDGRGLTWEDFCFKRAVLLLTTIYNGKDGREKVKTREAVEKWIALRNGKAPTKKREERTISDIWKDRDLGRNPPAWTPRKIKAGDPAYITRSTFLKILVAMAREDEARHEARRAKARAFRDQIAAERV